VAGLFVLVEALERSGAIAALAGLMRAVPAAMAGSGIALATNLANNLPVGLIGGAAVHSAGAPPSLAGAVLIGIDLGPNLSVTGSLATLLWLAALRREGISISTWAFLRRGAVLMPLALAGALAGLWIPSQG
jgi:arsenical pump membrane protein